MNPSRNLFPNDPKETTPMERTENDAIIQHAIEHAKPSTLFVTRGTSAEAHVVVIPKGMQAQSVKGLLDEYLPKPERRIGTTTITDPASFSAFVNRAKGDSTVVYVNEKRDPNTITAVFDHDAAGPDGVESARWGQHRAQYEVELSDEWAAWMKAHTGGALSQRDFAELIEDRATDLLDPDAVPGDASVELAARLGLTLATAREVIEAARGLKLRVNVNVGEAITLASGETELHYTEKHTDADGNPPKVPSAFLIGVPVLKGAPRDVLLVRLRYRNVPGQPRVLWAINLHRPDDVLRNAVNEVVTTIERDTGVPLFRGVAPPMK